MLPVTVQPSGGYSRPALCSLTRVRQALTTLVFLMPPSGLKNRLLNLLGHQVHPLARIGINVVRRVGRFELAEGVLIAHFNLFRDLALVQMGRGARIVMFNQIHGDSGYEPGAIDNGTLRTLRMGAHSHIISQHYLDCGGGLLLEDDCWVTGIRTTVLTHAFDPHEGGIVLEPVVLRKGAVVATCCTMLPGSVIGEGSLVAAGSTTWTRQEVAAESLAGGVPARRLSAMKISSWVYQRARYQGPEAL